MKEINKNYVDQYLKGLEAVKTTLAVFALGISEMEKIILKEVEQCSKRPNPNDLLSDLDKIKLKVVDYYQALCQRQGILAAFNCVTGQRLSETDDYLKKLKKARETLIKGFKLYAKEKEKEA